MNPSIIAAAARLACIQIGYAWRRRQQQADALMRMPRMA
jgi:hypothetical protein